MQPNKKRPLNRCWLWLALPAALLALGCVEQTGPVLTGVPTPDPVGPLPSAEQLTWQAQELSAFFHFGINTFSNKEQGDGTDSPTIFNPAALNPGQWMSTLQRAGFKQAMLTAKHHDGFCLWQTQCTTYSVAASPSWQGGQGDVVRQFVDAAHQANIRVGLALSPFDRHEPSAGTPSYQAVFECQLTELLKNYGAIDEIWLWSSPPPAPPFDWKAVANLVHKLQPHALLDIGNSLSTMGADVRSVGSALPTNMPADQTSVKMVANGASPAAPVWYPAESVHSMRPSWFWHAADDALLKTPSQLLDLYYNSVGRNSVLLLGLQPNTQGVIPSPDVTAMDQYGASISAVYQTNVVAARPGTADSVFRDAPGRAAAMAVDGKLNTFWAAGEGKTSARIEFDLGGPTSFNVVSIQEPIALGERTTAHHVEAKTNGTWTTIASGTAIGQRKLHRVGAVTASNIALVITQARGVPAIAEFSVYQSPFP